MVILFTRYNNIRHCAALLLAAVAMLFSHNAAHAFENSHWADTSKLASGKWVKLRVEESGIYAITAADASRWGLGDLSSVHVFGFGGAPISERLTSDIPDDLPQLPVVRTGDKLLFYAQGPTTWRTNSSTFTQVQVQHPYATAAYYFVTSDSRYSDAAITRSSVQPSASATPVTTFTGRLFHEQEIENPSQTGRNLLGENFATNTTQSFKFKLNGMVDRSTVKVYTVFAAQTQKGNNSQVSFQYNGTNLAATSSDYISPVSDPAHEHYNLSRSIKEFTLSGTNDLTYTVSLKPSGTLLMARLDYITVNYVQQLALINGSLAFGLDNASVNALYSISGCSATTHVWDVTASHAPVEMNVQLSGSNATFTPPTAGRREMIAFDENASYPSPTLVGTINNQNIHGEPTPDMIIISPVEYLSQARQVAQLHEKVDSMRVLVVDQNLVFNEFSSGTPDAMAYRMLCKLFYDRGADAAGHKLGYLLLFGNGCYDNRLLSNTMKVVSYPMLLTWQSSESSNENTSYTSDDIFVTLADNSGPSFSSFRQQVAVGRFPVRSTSQASTAVTKLVNYVTKPDYGSWKNNVLNVADDEDNAVHMQQADEVISTAKQYGGGDFLYHRVYIDAFNNTSTGGGRYYPDARKKMFNTLCEGTLWWNYTGHAGPTGWTADGLLRYADVQNELYYTHMPVLYAATCEFVRFDGPSPSGGEDMFLNSQGGVVSIICPPRLVYIPNNIRLNRSVAKYMFSRDANGLPRRLGDILMNGKNDVVGDDNNSRYFLMGDPAMRLAYPSYRAVVTSINDKDVTGNDDDAPVFMARQKLVVKGHIEDLNGDKATTFKGNVTATLYDSEESVTTHGYGDNGTEYTYQDRNNKLCVNIDTVSGGEFTLNITVPSEIINNYSPAMLSLYADNPTDSVEAQGSTSQFYLYGYADTEDTDTIGPTIEYFGLNSTDFKDGDNVNESPLVVAKVSDPSGINLSTSGIGHAITLTLDGQTSYSDVNTYYTPVATSDGSGGTIAYPLTSLQSGNHTLRLRVWDVFNNSSSSEINFNVVPGLKPSITDVYAVGNPASVEARFYVRHNRPDATLNVRLEVYDLMGRLMWSTEQTGRSNMFTSFPITWNLCDEAGRRVPRGIYVYRVVISTDGVQEASKAKKIAVAGE